MGPIELLAGLEREFVIILGFTHPRRLLITQPHVHVSEKGRVDSSVYQAITRTKYRLAVLEPQVQHLMRHYMLRKLDPATQTIPFFDENGETEKASVLVQSGGEYFLRSKLSLRSLSVLADLPQAEQSTVMDLHLEERVGPDELESAFRNGFTWSRLALLSALRIGLRSITTPAVLRLPQELRTLSLDNNQLKSVEGLGLLTALHTLCLHNNQLQSVKKLNSLTALHTLHLGNNQLTSVEGLDSLAALHALHLNDNQLTSVEGLGLLTALQTLYLEHNRELNKLPRHWACAASLQRFILDTTQLSRLRACLEQQGLQRALRVSGPGPLLNGV